jgi:3-phosphoshikimate 1-carboxyvinyltransferase
MRERDAGDIKIIQRFPEGAVTPPPSKSLCHRAVICAALAGGESVIANFSGSDDLDATVKGVASLFGTKTSLDNGSLYINRGDALNALNNSDGSRVVDCGESGSTLRFLLPIAALEGRETLFTGRGRLMKRPLDAYAKIFASSGVAFEQSTEGVRVKGPMKGNSFELPGNVSSQFISGMLFALPMLGGGEIRLSTPLESRQYVRLTMDVMRRFGVETDENSSSRVYSALAGRYRPASYRVEADYSQAAFFLSASALGRNVSVLGLDPESRQGDRAILSVLGAMGAEISWRGAAASTRPNHTGVLSAVTVDAREIPDLVPPIAALCCYCEGESRIVNAARLRLKESDRLSALASELKKLGANIVETGDSLSITGSKRLNGGLVNAWGDHRIAMALAVAAIRCEMPVKLHGWRLVNKSYPTFWRDFEGVCR